MDGGRPLPTSNLTLVGERHPRGEGSLAPAASNLRMKGTGRLWRRESLHLSFTFFLGHGSSENPVVSMSSQFCVPLRKIPVHPCEGSEVISSLEGFFNL